MKNEKFMLRNMALLMVLQVSVTAQETSSTNLRQFADFPETFIAGLKDGPSKAEPVSLVRRRSVHASGASPNGTYPIDSTTAEKVQGFKLTYTGCVLEHFGNAKLDYSKLEINSSSNSSPGGISFGDPKAKVTLILGQALSATPDSLGFIAQSSSRRDVSIDFVFKSGRLVSITWCRL